MPSFFSRFAHPSTAALTVACLSISLVAVFAIFARSNRVAGPLGGSSASDDAVNTDNTKAAAASGLGQQQEKPKQAPQQKQQQQQRNEHGNDVSNDNDGDESDEDEEDSPATNTNGDGSIEIEQLEDEKLTINEVIAGLASLATSLRDSAAAVGSRAQPPPPGGSSHSRRGSGSSTNAGSRDTRRENVLVEIPQVIAALYQVQQLSGGSLDERPELKACLETVLSGLEATCTVLNRENEGELLLDEVRERCAEQLRGYRGTLGFVVRQLNT